MASNKFATKLHRETNKITLVLIYAMLEWVLIILLLGNSLFSYLIVKFADYFGLKRPCIWCSRLDHILEPAKFKDSYRSLFCEAHSEEIARLGYCTNHRNLAVSRDMCEDCSSSSHKELPEKFAFFPWMEKLGILQVSGGGVKVIENGRKDLKCSCCGVVLNTKLYSHDYHLGKPSWEESHVTQNNYLILDSHGDEKVDEYDLSERNTSSCFVSDHGEDEQGIDENRGVHFGNREEETRNNSLFSVSTSISKYMAAAADDDDDDEKMDVAKEKEQEQFKQDECKESAKDESDNLPVMIQVGGSKDMSSETQPLHLEFYIDEEDCHLIPVELTDVTTTGEKLVPKRCEQREEEEICGDEDFVLEFDEDIVGPQYELIAEKTRNLEEEAPLLSGHDTEEQLKGIAFEFMEINEESFSGELEQPAIARETQSHTGHHVRESPLATGDEMDSDNNRVSEEVLQGQSNEVELVSEEVHQEQCNQVEAVSEEGLQLEGDEVEAEVSIGPEIPDQEPIDDIQAEDIASSYRCMPEDPSSSTANDNAYEEYVGCNHIEDVVEFKTMSVERSEPVTEYRLSFCSESNEIEEDIVPDTPTSIDSLHYLHKEVSLLERRESSAEESLDGSIISDIEAGGVMTVEKLKLALTAEKKALHALYVELEEERNASAVAANQTMAMINRLQEEKAAMQMEALQYQRMMEEQTEYDQEALQLLNEVMIKREKELELCRKKIQDYETREKMMVLMRRRRRKEGSSASCSAAEDSDGLSIDMDHDGREDRFNTHQGSNTENTPADAVLYLEESLTNFEKERLSILEQLKLLEEKLFTLSDDEDQHFEDIKPVEHLYEDNGYHLTPHSSIQANGVANGHHKETNGKHHPEMKNIGAKAKRLLPLFDATDVETEDGVLNGHEETNDSLLSIGPVIDGPVIDDRKLAIEEEVDHVYERLQALEADREFLKNCVTSLRKGDKGIELLQEILHHLRDLRRVEIGVRSMED